MIQETPRKIKIGWQFEVSIIRIGETEIMIALWSSGSEFDHGKKNSPFCSRVVGCRGGSRYGEG